MCWGTGLIGPQGCDSGPVTLSSHFLPDLVLRMRASVIPPLQFPLTFCGESGTIEPACLCCCGTDLKLGSASALGGVNFGYLINII